MTTTATLEDLDAITTQVEDARRRLAALPSGSPYEGVAEAALAGDPSDHHVIYDHSPILGEASPLAPPLRIAIEGDLVRGEVNFARQYEGPPGCVHGGFVAAAFDEVLGAAQCLSGAAGMTAHLEVDYRAPTPLEADLVFEGWLDRVEGRKVFVGGRCTAGGEMTAEATGLFVTFGVGQFAAMKAERDADR